MPPVNETTLGNDDRRGFGYGEHLLIWSWRRIAAGRGHCPLITREFADAFGEDAREVLATFRTFLQALAYASRRRLTVGHPGCLAVTADERRILTLIAAAQDNRPALFDAHLRWLARSEVRDTLAIGARALATALSTHDLCLALPTSQAPMTCERQAAVG